MVMPDHVHFLLRIKERSKEHLGYYIRRLKYNITYEISRLLQRSMSSEEIFEENYCDKPMFSHRSLKDVVAYIRQNPHRLAMRFQFPHFFQRTNNIVIAGGTYQGYGNLFLLRNPDKMAVKISRSMSEVQKMDLRFKWLEAAYNKTVLVSPFISKEEKEIRKAAEELGGQIILITHEVFPERFKPERHNFELCSSGQLLIISLGMPAGTPLSREICVRMNELALALSGI